MAIIYSDQSRSRFFLIPRDAEVPAGSLHIATLTGTGRDVDEEAARAFEIPEADAKAHVAQKMAAVQSVVQQVLASLKGGAGAAPGGAVDLAAMLQTLGVSMEDAMRDPSGTARALSQRLMERGLDEIQALGKS